MSGRQRGPVVVVNAGEVGGDLLVVENKTGIAIGLDALIRPVMAAEYHRLAVHYDGLVMASWLKAENAFWEAKRDQHVEALLFHHVATDDADVEFLLDLFEQRANQRAKLGEVFRRAAEIDVLVLKPEALLGRFDELKGQLGVIVGREQRLHADFA